VPGDADKIMFEVYREAGFNRGYHVVYFTELEEGERDEAIDAAMSGVHFFNGFIKAADGTAAKTVILDFVARLNQGVAGTTEELARLLAPFLAR
jgi:hypothetical protein